MNATLGSWDDEETSLVALTAVRSIQKNGMSTANHWVQKIGMSLEISF